MDTEVNRDNLGDLVEQFLSHGGTVKELAAQQPATMKETKRLGISKAKAKAIRNPLSEPISLAERTMLPDVRRCIEEGMMIGAIITELKTTRGAILRIVHAYGLKLPTPYESSRKRVSDEDALREILAGLREGRSLSATCSLIHIKSGRGMELYTAYRAKHSDCPSLTKKPGRHSPYSDAEVLELVLIGLEANFTVRQSCANVGVCSNRGTRLYKAYLAERAELSADRSSEEA